MTENILDELTWRGLIAQSTDLDALRKDLEAGPVTLYAGSTPQGRACTPDIWFLFLHSSVFSAPVTARSFLPAAQRV